MAEAPEESKPAADGKRSGSGKAPAGAPTAKPAGKKKITAAEAKKKLKGQAVADPAAPIGGKVRKKPPTPLDLPKDFSKQIGLKKAGDADGADADTGAPARPRHDPNLAIHTTGRDRRETRKVRLLLVLAVLVVLGVIAGVAYLQLRDPDAGDKAQLLTLQMNYYRQALPQWRSKLPAGAPATATAGLARQAIAGLLNEQYTQAAPAAQEPPAASDNPELYSLNLARQFLDPFDRPIRVGVIDGKIVIRSFGADGIDQTGDTAATVQGDDQVVSE